jgi:hypothetical protein
VAISLGIEKTTADLEQRELNARRAAIDRQDAGAG